MNSLLIQKLSPPLVKATPILRTTAHELRTTRMQRSIRPKRVPMYRIRRAMMRRIHKTARPLILINGNIVEARIRIELIELIPTLRTIPTCAACELRRVEVALVTA
jgi:hypothetical protein